jgi:hypothetical protein
MAKNNFKKKKTLKRSFRRNYTKKVASASLGSRTPNIRKKNRRSQKQRTTLRNKRNARVKIGGVLPFTNTIMENLKAGTMEDLLTYQTNRIAELDRKAELEEEKQRRNAEQYTWDPEREAMRQKKKEEEIQNTERTQRNYYYKIEPELNVIAAKMRNVKDYIEERELFEAAEKLISPYKLSQKDLISARDEVLGARNRGAAKKINWPQMKHWYFDYDYDRSNGDAKYRYDYYDYDNPPKIKQETEHQTNPQQLSVHSGVAPKYPLTDDDDDDEDYY